MQTVKANQGAHIVKNNMANWHQNFKALLEFAKSENVFGLVK